MKKILQKIFNHKVNGFSSFLLIVLIAIVVFSGYQQVNLTEQENKSSYLKEKITAIEQKTNDLEIVLLSNQEENTTLADALTEAKERSEKLERRFEKVNDNVDELEKITKTDPELLQKYSKVFFLNEHYSPPDLDTIPSKYTYDQNRTYEIHEEVSDFLVDLLEEAEDDDIDLKVISAFRSFDEQAQLKGAYTVQYGSGANQFSADQGYSEHQLGTTVDFTNSVVGATFTGFAQTESYQWLQENAHRFGFTLSYPENNQYYQFEPWHWRFVGRDLADDLRDDGINFYDLSQREIDEYIVDLFD
jgi:D-alanyl-D-alanine carboxypeptidase